MPMYGPRLCSAPPKRRCAASGAREKIASLSSVIDGVCGTACSQSDLFLADAPSHSRGAFRPSFAVRSRPMEAKGRREGRAPAAPAIRAQQKCTRGGSQVCRSPGLPCADGFNGVLRALLGERCTIAPVALRMADARARSGRRITARLDARTAGVGTTRLLRPRTALPQYPGLHVRAPDHQQDRCDRAVS